MGTKIKPMTIEEKIKWIKVLNKILENPNMNPKIREQAVLTLSNLLDTA